MSETMRRRRAVAVDTENISEVIMPYFTGQASARRCPNILHSAGVGQN